jgi:aspartate racemase
VPGRGGPVDGGPLTATGRLARVKTIGLVGGMSWESSAVYYKLLNEGVEERVGGLASAPSVMVSVDFAQVTALQEQERWDDVAEVLAEAARGVERAGADFLLLCTTAFHRVAEQVEAAVDIPLLHLADVVAADAAEHRLTSVGLIGTTFTMSRTFFTDRIASHGLEVVVPKDEHHETLNRIIYDELVHGKVVDDSRREVVRIVEELWDAGAGGVILGCTELELLVRQADVELPVLGSTTLHVKAALDRALTD